MNESTRSLMSVLGVPVFEWASKVQGSPFYHDAIHFISHGPANW